jgi:hypothetical protein
MAGKQGIQAMPKRDAQAFIDQVGRHSCAAVCGLALIIMAGCSTTTTQSFKVAPSSNVEAAYVAVDADFSKYHQLMGEEMGIFFPQTTPLPDEDVQRLRQIFRDAFLARLADYTIVEEAGPRTLAVQASLIDLRKAGYRDLPGIRAELRDVAQPGELLFLMELKDSETDRVLARAADSSAKPEFKSDRSGATDWAGVEAAAEHWATLFRNFLDNNLVR